MKISLVIPAYNEEKYIGECLEYAIKNSQGAFYEIIVVDNASTDRTKEIAETFSDVRVVHEPSKGLTKARQKGLSEAQGELIAYIDADTRMPVGWVKKVIEAFKKNPKSVAVSGPYIYHDVSWFAKQIVWLYWNVLARVSYFFTGYMIVGGNFVAKKSAILEIGGFDTTIAFYGEDTDIARRLSKVGKVLFKNKLSMETSARRFKGEGFVSTGWRYIINFTSITTKGKPTTDEYNDIR